jgi:glucosamine-6-phosphate deaminase
LLASGETLLDVSIHSSKTEMGKAAAAKAAHLIREAIADRGEAVIILATGTSQFDTLASLTGSSGIGWERVVLFHLDEYIGIGAGHPASFRRYLSERFVSRVGALKAVHFIEGESEDPLAECARIGAAISRRTVDVALVGIGENGHLAFNDPPADFETDAPYIVVELDEICRRQQLGEGWFKSLDEVPCRAISMSIRQIMKSRSIIASVPERRKAAAVERALEGPVAPGCPSSILRRHSRCSLYLDAESAGLLTGKYRGGN